MRNIVVMAFCTEENSDNPRGALRFYEGVNRVLEFEVGSRVLYCTVAVDQQDGSSHLVACCEDFTGFVYPIVDVINGILKTNSQQDVNDDASEPNLMFDDPSDTISVNSDFSEVFSQASDDGQQSADHFDELNQGIITPPIVSFTRNVKQDDATNNENVEDEDFIKPRTFVPIPRTPPRPYPSSKKVVNKNSTVQFDSTPIPTPAPIPEVKPVQSKKKLISKAPTTITSPKSSNYGNPKDFVKVLVDHYNQTDPTTDGDVSQNVVVTKYEPTGTSRLLEHELHTRMNEQFDRKEAQAYREQESFRDVGNGPYALQKPSKTLNYGLHEKAFGDLESIPDVITTKKDGIAINSDETRRTGIIMKQKRQVVAPHPSKQRDRVEKSYRPTLDEYKHLQEDWEKEEECARDDFVCHMSKLRPQSQTITDTLFIKDFLLQNNT
ncbi:hypothetical protein AKO1_001030, partial [Acrasis kona]